MTDPTLVIDMRDVHISLGQGKSHVNVLQGAFLQIEKGQSVALLGPSGSGKSTLLMAVTGLEAVDEGNLLVAGEDIAVMSEDQLARFRGKNIGIIFQSFHLIPTMTALENVAVPLEIAGEPDALDQAEAMLGCVGLGDRIGHYPAELSGGEQQRVAIARAICAQPAIIVADEPTGNLDRETGEKIADLLFDRHRELGTTLFLVTHDENLAKRCQRVLRMRDGQVIEDPMDKKKGGRNT